MKVTKGLKNAHSSYPTILTLGTFDGIHQGHKTIISKLTGESKKNNLRSIILTFFPHPRNVVGSEKINSIVIRLLYSYNCVQMLKFVCLCMM